MTAWLPFRGLAGHKPTILYSHPNALDLGECLPFCRALGALLHVNVLAYDYSGYGAPALPHGCFRDRRRASPCRC